MRALSIPGALLFLLLGLVIPPLAAATDGRLAVGATVLPRHSDATLLERLPRPAGAVPMAGGRGGVRQHIYPDTLASARAYYLRAMPAQGYRLRAEHTLAVDAVDLAWEKDGVRVLVQLRGALGVPATRIGVSAERRPDPAPTP